MACFSFMKAIFELSDHFKTHLTELLTILKPHPKVHSIEQFYSKSSTDYLVVYFFEWVVYFFNSVDTKEEFINSLLNFNFDLSPESPITTSIFYTFKAINIEINESLKISDLLDIFDISKCISCDFNRRVFSSIFIDFLEKIKLIEIKHNQFFNFTKMESRMITIQKRKKINPVEQCVSETFCILYEKILFFISKILNFD